MQNKLRGMLYRSIFFFITCLFQLQVAAQQDTTTERGTRPFKCGKEFQRKGPFAIQKVFWNEKLSHDQYVAFLRYYDHRLRQAWARVENEQTREQNIKRFTTAELADCLQANLTDSDQVWRFDEFSECKKKRRYIFRSRFHHCQSGTLIVRQGKVIFKHLTDEIFID
jgi:hypothetical protein